ncbi:hypothetical protein ABZ897_56480 [Nonomuraea sp. NPDC046802]|uniref:hypothetical protein n=1 Tax=Nonomuraea sp. NPDC046802 TaxID=3154919 RepID=UPI0033FDDF45
MIPEEREIGQGRRAALAALALGAATLIIYAVFASGFGRPLPAGPVDRPGVVPARVADDSVLAVVTGDFWLTYLPAGLERTGGGVVDREDGSGLQGGVGTSGRRSGGGAVGPAGGVEGGWARFGTADRYVEARIEHGAVATTWKSYRDRVALLETRATVVRGRPAVVGRHPGGGRVIVWLERAGTGAWVRVSDSLGNELVAVAASAKLL